MGRRRKISVRYKKNGGIKEKKAIKRACVA